MMIAALILIGLMAAAALGLAWRQSDRLDSHARQLAECRKNVGELVNRVDSMARRR